MDSTFLGVPRLIVLALSKAFAFFRYERVNRSDSLLTMAYWD